MEESYATQREVHQGAVNFMVQVSKSFSVTETKSETTATMIQPFLCSCCNLIPLDKIKINANKNKPFVRHMLEFHQDVDNFLLPKQTGILVIASS
jgi:hypothetical protein